MAEKIEGIVTAKGLRFALIIGRFNELIATKLKEGAIDCLMRHEADEKKITEVYVPGAFEIPVVAKKLAASRKYDAVIALGAVIRGATTHYDLVASETAKGVAAASMETGVPVIFGVLTCDTIEQAVERAGTKSGNKGWDAAIAAMEMANLMRKI
jgi:6,7-dimethyl-8-ribityllumazine synthase